MCTCKVFFPSLSFSVLITKNLEEIDGIVIKVLFFGFDNGLFGEALLEVSILCSTEFCPWPL